MISIIVCTYNRASVLRRMLASFFNQEDLNTVNYEILIIDNNSNDETKSVASEFLFHHESRYIFEPKQGLSAARNRGVLESKGDIIAFLDDDVIVDKHWLKQLNECFIETNADAVGGRAYLIMEKQAPEWLDATFKVFLSEVELGDTRQFRKNGQGLWGLNLSFRRSALNEAGGFDEKLGRIGGQLIGAEETVILERLAVQNKRIVYEPKAIVGHIIAAERMEWDYFLRLAVDSGKTKFLKDWKSGACWQLLRVSNSLYDYVVSIIKMSIVNLVASSDYEKKLAKWWVIAKKSYLTARWQQLKTLTIGYQNN
jgi:glucosyl-dolichyl phosphate glucuronosyltransferase